LEYFAGDNLEMAVIAKIIIMVGILAFVFGGLFPWAQGLIKQAEGGYETSIALANAIECAYKRCVDGCGGTTDNIKFPNPDDSNKELTCTELFCDDEYMEDNKVCDENAKEDPVVIDIEEESLRISLTDLYFIEGCPGGECCIASQEEFKYVLQKPPTVWIQEELVDDVIETKSCGSLSPSMSLQGAKTVAINTGTYYIWAEDVVDGDKRGIVVVWNEQIEPKLECDIKRPYFDECEVDEHCTAMGTGDVCNQGTCLCEVSTDQYCCYFGGAGDMYGNVDCMIKAGCESVSGTFEPVLFNPPKRVDPISCGEPEECPAYDEIQ